MYELFDKKELSKLYKASQDSSGEDNGQVTMIGGSKLFHGAPIFSLKVASRIVDMVFFATPDESVGRVAEKIKSKLMSFIWIPWKETERYVEKSDAILIGPGLMSYRGEKKTKGEDQAYIESRSITEGFLKKFPKKRWVIDAGSLQVMDTDWIPKGAILTPNKREYELLFGDLKPFKAAKKYDCVINSKGPTNIVCSSDKCVEIKGGNPGLTKGGTGDVLAGLAVSLLAKNDPFLAAASASYITKAAADELHKKVGTNYSADDLVDKIPEVFHDLTL